MYRREHRGCFIGLKTSSGAIGTIPSYMTRAAPLAYFLEVNDPYLAIYALCARGVGHTDTGFPAAALTCKPPTTHKNHFHISSRERSNVCGGFSLTNFATALTLVSLILPTNFAHIATANHTRVDNEYGHAILKLRMPQPMRSAAITGDTMH